MNYESIIALAVAVFFVIILGYAMFFGSNVPYLLQARQRAIKELDPNAALNVKAQLYDSAVLSKPSNGAASRLICRGHQHAMAPEPMTINGLLVDEKYYVVAFYRRWFWHKSVMLVLREFCTPPTTPDMLLQATGFRCTADHYWMPSYSDKLGNPLPKDELIKLDYRTKRYWRQLVADYMYANTININAKQQAQAQHGRDTSNIYFPERSPMAGGDPQSWEQDQLGQRVQQERR